MDDFNAIRALNLQFEMQKAGSTHGTGSFFRVIFNFSARKIFPAALADAAFYSPTVGATCFLLSKSFSIIEYYSENEWAGLNGSYIRSWEENTEGYSVKIVGYEVMEKEKYFSKYDLSGKDQSVADPFAYIMEVTIKIKNEENETGKLQIADWALIGKNDDFIAYLDQQLLMDTDERVDSILSSISTASGKEIEIKLPYPLIYMDKEKEIDRNMPYKIAVTKYPSRKYIQFG